MGRNRPGRNFQPVLIILQIICMQCLFYLGWGTFAAACHIILESPIALDHFFTDRYVNFSSWGGWTECLINLCSGVIGAYLLSVVVEKSKKCVDFTFTVYFIHVITCSNFRDFPLMWEWWISIIISSIVMASLGEYWCAQQEMEDIPAIAASYEH